MIGFDYEYRIAPSALRAAGCSVVFRYTMPQTPYWVKALRNAEATELLAAGFPIASNFESSANRMLGGAAAGRADAQTQLADWAALGAPHGLKAWFSADWDVQPSEVAVCLAYLNAAAAVLGSKAYVGCYGGFRVCKAAADAGFGIWQTVAWSRNSHGVVQWDPRAAARQTGEQRTVGGVQVDVNEISNLGALGAWAPRGTPVPIPSIPTPGDDVTPQDIAAIAAAVYDYGREDIPAANGVLHNAPLGQLAHGAWMAVNDPKGPVLSGLAAFTAKLDQLLAPPPVDVDALATKIVAAIQSHLTFNVDAQAVAVAVQAQLAQALGGHAAG